ncbi:MAG TPA: hypothetical protein ENK66_03595 [Arcobacter sp.]|nr:hypothetical protein [Arcobacter sp.]
MHKNNLELIKIKLLKSLKKLYYITFLKFFKTKKLPNAILNEEDAYHIMYTSIISNKPLMIARFGATELSCVMNYLSVVAQDKNYVKYITGEISSWWWEDSIFEQMQNWSGFYPATTDNIKKFSKLILQDKNEVDILGSWLIDEKNVEKDMHDVKIHLRFLEPFWSKKPWTEALKNKKVLVVHPFSKTILKQYEKRDLLFSDKKILPNFESINIIKAVQSLGTGDDRFRDWFEALEYMKDEIDKVDYDVCLIGAGAYGFSLAAYIKRQGKIAIHMGGALQLLFGIKGNRWEDSNYGVKEWGIKPNAYVNLMNKHWVRPSEEETPQCASAVEGASYW